MGLLRHILLGDLGQSMDILEAKETMDSLKSRQLTKSSETNLEITRLKRRNEQLHLAITALTRHLIAKGVVDPAELAAFVDQIDAMDGKADGALESEDQAPAPKRIAGERAGPLRRDR